MNNNIKTGGNRDMFDNKIYTPITEFPREQTQNLIHCAIAAHIAYKNMECLLLEQDGQYTENQNCNKNDIQENKFSNRKNEGEILRYYKDDINPLTVLFKWSASSKCNGLINVSNIQYYLLYNDIIKKYILTIRGTYMDDKDISINNWGTNVQLGLYSIRKKFISFIQLVNIIPDHDAKEIGRLQQQILLTQLAKFLCNLLLSTINDLFYIIPGLLNQINKLYKILERISKKFTDMNINDFIIMILNRPNIKASLEYFFTNLIQYRIDSSTGVYIPDKTAPKGQVRTIENDKLNLYNHILLLLNPVYTRIKEEITLFVAEIIKESYLLQFGSLIPTSLIKMKYDIPDLPHFSTPWTQFLRLLDEKEKELNSEEVKNKLRPVSDILYNYLFEDYIVNACEFSDCVYEKCCNYIMSTHQIDMNDKIQFIKDNLLITGHSLAGGITQYLSRKYNNICFAFNPVGTNIIDSHDPRNNILDVDSNNKIFINDKLRVNNIGKNSEEIREEYECYNDNLFNIVVHFDIVHKIRLSDNCKNIHNSRVYLASLDIYLGLFNNSYKLNNEQQPLLNQVHNIIQTHGMEGLLLLLLKIYKDNVRHCVNQLLLDFQSYQEDNRDHKSALYCIENPINFEAQSMLQNKVKNGIPASYDVPIIDKFNPSYKSENMETRPILCVPNLDNWRCPYCWYACNSRDNERCTQCYIIKSELGLEQLAKLQFNKPLLEPVPSPRSVWNAFGLWRNKYKKYKTKYLKLKNKLNK